MKYFIFIEIISHYFHTCKSVTSIPPRTTSPAPLFRIRRASSIGQIPPFPLDSGVFQYLSISNIFQYLNSSTSACFPGKPYCILPLTLNQWTVFPLPLWSFSSSQVPDSAPSINLLYLPMGSIRIFHSDWLCCTWALARYPDSTVWPEIITAHNLSPIACFGQIEQSLQRQEAFMVAAAEEARHNANVQQCALAMLTAQLQHFSSKLNSNQTSLQPRLLL